MSRRSAQHDQPVTCDLCGLSCSSRGLVAHQKGHRCRVQRVIRQRESAGLRALDLSWEYSLRAAGVSFVRDFFRYSQGDAENNFEPRLIVGLYVTRDVWEVAQLLDVTRLAVMGSMVLSRTARDPEFACAVRILAATLGVNEYRVGSFFRFEEALRDLIVTWGG